MPQGRNSHVRVPVMGATQGYENKKILNQIIGAATSNVAPLENEMSAAQVIPEEARRTYLGSHDTAGIAGYSPYLTPMQIYMNKLGMTEGRETTPLMEWGTRLQAPILAKFAEVLEADLEGERFIRHPSLPWFGGTPDATIKGKKAGVDAKYVQYFNEEWGDEGTDQIPRHLLFQCHHFLALMNYDVWYVAALGNRSQFRIYEVLRDQEIADIIIGMDGEFWKEHILREIPPPMDGSYSWRKYIERIHPKETAAVRAATPEESVWMEDLRRAEAEKNDAESRAEAAKNRLAASIGDAAGIVSDAGRITYKQAKGAARLDGKALLADMPNVYWKYATVGEPRRRFVATFKKED